MCRAENAPPVAVVPPVSENTVPNVEGKAADTNIPRVPSMMRNSASEENLVPQGKSGLAYVLNKLITKEDPMMIHKICGLFALFSFGYRYFYMWPRTGAHANSRKSN